MNRVLAGSCLSAAVTLGVFTPVLTLVDWPRPDPVPATEAPPGEWPMMGGTPGRNGLNLRDRNIPERWASEVRDRTTGLITRPAQNIKWVAKLGTRAYGGPVIAKGKIYVGTNNENPRDPSIKGDKSVLMCFREADGEFLWQIIHDKIPDHTKDWPREGLWSSPVVEGDHLWYVSNRSELICADADSGAIVWRLDMMADCGVQPHYRSRGSPLIIGDNIFVTTGNGVDATFLDIPAPEAPSFVAVDKHTGHVRWQSNLPTAAAANLRPPGGQQPLPRFPLKSLMDQGRVIMQGQWADAAAGTVRGRTRVVFPGGDGWLYCFAPSTGKLLWKFDANPKCYQHALGGRGQRSDFVAAPVIVGDRLYIGTGQDPEHYEGVGHLWCIDLAASGDVSPDYPDASNPTAPTLRPNGQSAAIWHYGGPTTPADAKQLGRDYYFGRTMSNVVVHDGLVYAAELAGYLHCLDAETGSPYWVHDLKASVWGSPYLVDNKVFIGTDDGEVWVLRHGKQCQFLNKVQVRDGTPVNAIVSANNTLYVKTQNSLYAIALP